VEGIAPGKGKPDKRDASLLPISTLSDAMTPSLPEMLTVIFSTGLGERVVDFVKAHQVWTPFIAFLLAFAESLAVIGLFVPATFALVGIGALIGAAGVAGPEFRIVWLAAAMGAALGDWASYFVGYKLENTAKHVWPLSRYPDLYERGERFFRRWGVWSIFLGRFFGPVRAVVPLVAGVFEMPMLLFQLANVSSAMVWAFVLLAPGFAALELLRY
jgi:membrane protein DedA with SNARE-associated domain